MSERWKYQIKTGLPWGIFMTVFMILVAYILLGIFVLGYSSWKSKVKRESK